MRIIEASIAIEPPAGGTIPTADQVYEFIERVGRTCYKSEDKICPGSAKAFVKKILTGFDRPHEAIIEHHSISVRFIIDRGISHEAVRHRIASFAQESTRYCNYSKGKFGGEITVVEPLYFKSHRLRRALWKFGCKVCEWVYFAMLKTGAKPQEARAILPNSLKTELVMTCNLREWRHFLALRSHPAAHPQMREVANRLHDYLRDYLPAIFEDIPIHHQPA